MILTEISLHSFPPTLSLAPHPAIGYLKGFIQSKNLEIAVNSYYWNQKIITDCFKDVGWLQEIIVDSETSASVFRSLFGYLFLQDLEMTDNKEEGLDFFSTWGSFYCPSISKKQFLAMAVRLDRFINTEIERNNLAACHITGGSTNLGQEIPCLMVLHRIKQLNPRILTVCGGMSAREGELIMKMFPFIDICVHGEGEQALLEICDSYPAGKPLADIKGIVWRQDDGTVYANAEHPVLTDIDNHWANYEGYRWDLDKDFKMISIWDSRSCHWGKCTFCHRTSQTNAFRERSIDDILAEIHYQLEASDVQVDDNYMIRFLGSDVRGSSDERLLSLLRELAKLKEHYQKMTIFAELNPRYMTEEMMGYLDVLEARIQFGFEQWNPRILKLMKKPHGVEHAIYTLKLVEEYPSVRVVGFNLLCGYPGEMYSDVYQSFQTLMKMKYIMALLYRKDRNMHMISNPVSMNPCTPLGQDWSWENPLVQKMIETAPLTRAFGYLSGNPLLAKEFMTVHSYMTVLDLHNTDSLQKDLLKKYEEILRSSRIEVNHDQSKGTTLRLMTGNQVQEIPLSHDMLKVLQITEKPVSSQKLKKELDGIDPEVIKRVISQLEENDLIYSYKNRLVNTLPYHIQQQLAEILRD
ncbi:MAG: radical SAM protein [Candidatus Odinarchaeota archaeon]